MNASPPKSGGFSSWRVLLWATLGPLGCVCAALLINQALFWDTTPETHQRALQSAVLVPVSIGVPLFLFYGLRVRELAIANHKLRIIAALDGLTACLNRNAFAAQVNARAMNENIATRSGALLILDADRFKTINDRFGHQAGDRALELIAETLRCTVRAGDIVGRLGGEEFGVFLPDIDRVSAGRVAERLRLAVAEISFEADGQKHPLSVSVGGVAYDDRASFEMLFQQADERLYFAKQTGRNRVAMTSLLPIAANG